MMPERLVLRVRVREILDLIRRYGHGLLKTVTDHECIATYRECGRDLSNNAVKDPDYLRFLRNVVKWLAVEGMERRIDLSKVVDIPPFIVEPGNNYQGDALDLIRYLKDGSIPLTVTSPPYALQMEKYYRSYHPDVFPAWVVSWMTVLLPKLTSHGSVVMVINSHYENFAVHPFVNNTITALEKNGWQVSGRCYWYKPDGPPPGNNEYFRVVTEDVIWFSPFGSRPKINVRALGKPSSNLFMKASSRHYNKSGVDYGKDNKSGTARAINVFKCAVNKNSRNVDHPSQFPIPLVRQFLKTWSDKGDLVLDPFMGSGTTALACIKTGRQFIGFDIEQRFVDMANERVAELLRSKAANP